MRTIVMGNLKGGVGKTTSAVNLAYSLVSVCSGARVLCVDLDPQANLTPFFAKANHAGYTVRDILLNPEKADRAVYRGKYRDLKIDIIRGNTSLAEQDVVRPNQLIDALEHVKEKYDYCVIDTRPVFENLTYSALYAADLLLVPVFLDNSCRDNLTLVEESINGLPKELKWKVFANKVDTRRRAQKKAYHDLVGRHDYPFMDTCISSDAAVGNALDLYKPVYRHSTKSRAAQDYLDLAREVIGMEGR